MEHRHIKLASFSVVFSELPLEGLKFISMHHLHKTWFSWKRHTKVLLWTITNEWHSCSLIELVHGKDGVDDWELLKKRKVKGMKSELT
jgi:hypothetical protein